MNNEHKEYCKTSLCLVEDIQKVFVQILQPKGPWAVILTGQSAEGSFIQSSITEHCTW